ncbi:MAG: ATP-dependent protease ATPase subunit HslU, partial [Pseudomonadota bacterium]
MTLSNKITPKEIVKILDDHIVGQPEAKRAIAISYRNRICRLQVEDATMRQEIVPKNILMIGPTGVGKTEISRRLAKITDAPFLKIEATKFTEVGYVGRDVDSIIRDLADNAIVREQDRRRQQNKTKAQQQAKKRVLDALAGESSSDATRELFDKKLDNGDFDNDEVKIKITEQTGNNPFQFADIPGMPGSQMGMLNIGEMISKAMGGSAKPRKTKTMLVKDALEILEKEEIERIIENQQEEIVKNAINNVEQNGIVFIDEIDKICMRENTRGRDISGEGVQRDLLPLIEGAVVSTKYGMIKTDHILFIASGAFHLAKPSDLLPELQGRLPVRVELKALTKSDMIKILTEPKYNLIKQYQALFGTDGIDLEIKSEAIDAIADYAVNINSSVENIGARRLHTLLEKLLEDLSFEAPDLKQKKVVFDRKK